MRTASLRGEYKIEGQIVNVIIEIPAHKIKDQYQITSAIVCNSLFFPHLLIIPELCMI